MRGRKKKVQTITYTSTLKWKLLPPFVITEQEMSFTEGYRCHTHTHMGTGIT